MYYAKSKPDILSILEHTNDVLVAVEMLYHAYGKHLSFFKEKEWELLRLAALYHDIGKYSTGFQNSIKKVIEEIKDCKTENYPHNYLSVAMVPFEELENKYDLDALECMCYSIAFHHERTTQPSKEKVKEIFNRQILPYKEKIKYDFKEILDFNLEFNELYLDILEKRANLWKGEDKKNLYILLKGLLHRADYAASAKRKEDNIADFIEQGVEASVGIATESYFEKMGYKEKRELQQFAFENQDINILLVAQTGSGKTEAALFWIGDSKGFITLPLRVSINDMYNRIQKEEGIGFESTGLLHSGALDYLVGTMEADEATFGLHAESVKKAALLSYKLTLSTIDQIFKFPLLYQGFERELATLAYSKVVIDEIQAYNPHIVAILIKGLEMITTLGGKWMIMTATLPAIFKEALQKRGLLKEQAIEKTILLPDDTAENCEIPRRHRIHVVEDSILNAVETILEYGQQKKVLVVVNTIKQSMQLYDLLSEETEDVTLLHSQFITKDRQKKEQRIKKFAQLNNNFSGIWVTTQVVEASLDVDFDYLFTEVATPDSLFQRFGRCNRKGKRYKDSTIVPTDPNVFIYTEEASGVGYVYEEEIVNNGLMLLKNYDGELMSEQNKLDIVENVFRRESLCGTKYLEQFDKALEELDFMTPFNKKSTDAQQILRNIQSVQLIPSDKLYQEAEGLRQLYYKTPKNNEQERKKIKMQIEQLTVSVNKFTLKIRAKENGFKINLLDERVFQHIYYAPINYEEERGMEYICDSIESRFF
ncbi:CRISPR-associated helicase Cas3' [Lysinibacillus sp. 54212]|uniref:CRISPR-associated helicase Cas3' n=1 Tax=Lysinibacillus sp. 54212 TaxID=3119829 RepID=UPI002FCBF9A8